jgi:hypothetical protein
MKTERQSFIQHYKDLAELVMPRKGRFFTENRNRGDKRQYNKIINSVATQALRTASNGMFSGVSSPSRPWFVSETDDMDLMEFGPVKIWLNDVDLLFRNILSRSNFYNMMPVKLMEVLLFGTGAMSHVDDAETLARFYTHTAGSYMIGQNDRYLVDRFAREIEMTTSQLVNQFGLENVSATVKSHFERGEFHKWHKVRQLIEPNPAFDEDALDSQFKRFRSTYWEVGSADRKKKLSVSGFDEFPVYVTRWSVTGEDIYGTDCPAMTSLGDIRGLQIEERRKAQAIDKFVNPPLQGPPSIRNIPVQSLAGGLNIYEAAGTQTLAPVYQVDPRLNELRADMAAIENRINQAFFVDLFLAISNMEGVQPRNQLELSQRNQERLLQLGPVLERLQSEFLDPMINRLFAQAIRADILPPIPEELEGTELNIRYVSSLAQAQRAVASGPIERLAGFVQVMAQTHEDVIDKFDADQAVDEYAELTGVIPTIVVPDDAVQEIRTIRAQQQQAEQEIALQQAGAEIANTTADTASKIEEA